MIKTMSKKEALEDRLGAVLGRSCRLGVKIVLSPSVALVFLKIYFLEKMRFQEATWVDLGSIWVAKRGRLGRPFGVKLV